MGIMSIMNLFVLFIFFYVMDFDFTTIVEAEDSNSDRIRLRDIEVLTLHVGQMTLGRRVSPVPQLERVGGNARSDSPKVVQCYNRGWDGNEVQWECKAHMDNCYKFGKITVICEGYDYAGDEFVLKNSCGLEYELDLTNECLVGSQIATAVVFFIIIIFIIVIITNCPPTEWSDPNSSEASDHYESYSFPSLPTWCSRPSRSGRTVSGFGGSKIR